MYDEMHKWLILGSNLSHVTEILNDSAFTVSTDVIIAVSSANDYILYDVYNPCKDRGGSMNVTLFGTWNSKTGLNVSMSQSKFERRANLHGMKLKVGVVVSRPSRSLTITIDKIRISVDIEYTKKLADQFQTGERVASRGNVTIQHEVEIRPIEIFIRIVATFVGHLQFHVKSIINSILQVA